MKNFSKSVIKYRFRDAKYSKSIVLNNKCEKLPLLKHNEIDKQYHIY